MLAQVSTSGANQKFMFLDPNFCPIPNWDLIGISLIFGKSSEHEVDSNTIFS